MLTAGRPCRGHGPVRQLTGEGLCLVFDFASPYAVDGIRRTLLSQLRARRGGRRTDIGLPAGGWQALAPAVFEHLAPAHGLPHPVVMRVVQDGAGNVISASTAPGSTAGDGGGP